MHAPTHTHTRDTCTSTARIPRTRMKLLTFIVAEQFSLVDNDLLKKVDSRLNTLNQLLRSLQGSCVRTAVSSLETQFRVNFTYSSNYIEGNTYTQPETEDLLLRQKPSPHRTTHEQREIEDHDVAWSHVKQKLSKTPPQQWYLNDLLSLHWLATRSTLTTAGKLREHEVRISNSPTITPKHEEVPALMDDLLRWLRQAAEDHVHPVLLAAAVHSKLAQIHPFQDGNGRTSRLAMNAVLLHYGFLPTVISEKKKSRYYAALAERSVNKNSKPFFEFVLEHEQTMLDSYIEFLTAECSEKQTI